MIAFGGFANLGATAVTDQKTWRTMKAIVPNHPNECVSRPSCVERQSVRPHFAALRSCGDSCGRVTQKRYTLRQVARAVRASGP